jgi:transporter family-2 protein
MKLVYLIALAAGTFSALQSAVNTRLSQHVGGPVMSATVSVLITTVCLIITTLITRAPLPTSTALAAAPWWSWAGGIIGAAFLVTVIFAIHGGTPVPFTLWRGLGAVLLIAGVWLINRQG